MLSERVIVHKRSGHKLATTMAMATVGRAGFSISGGRAATVVVRMKPTVERALVHSRHDRITVLATARRTDGGAAAHANITLTLASKPRRRRH